MRPGQVRAFVGAFTALSVGIIINTLFMQNDPAAIAAKRAAAERAAARAELQRVRRLSVDVADKKGARARVERRMRAGKTRRASRKSRAAGLKVRRIAELQHNAARLSSAPDLSKPQASSPRETVRAIQRELTQKNYEPGLADGVPGLMTRAAIMAYEADQNMSLTGEPNEALLQQIVFGTSYGVNDEAAGRSGGAQLPAGAKPHAEQVTRTVQQSLLTLGYHHGSADGTVGDITRQAIREFEMDHGLVPTGRISGRLVAQLAKLAGQGRLAAKRK